MRAQAIHADASTEGDVGPMELYASRTGSSRWRTSTGDDPMIEMAPIQMFVFGFEDAEQFTPAIIREVESLQKRGLIRLIDLLYVERLADGSLVTSEMTGLTPSEMEEFGGLLERLLGMESDPAPETAEPTGRTPFAAQDDSLFYGIAREDMAGVIDDIPPGGAAVMALFEHCWAFDIRNKIRRATGFPIAQGFLTPELFLLVGEELRMMREAANAIELAQEVRGAALLEALESIVGTESADERLVASTVDILQSGSRRSVANAAATVRALIEGGFLRESAAEDAIRYLVRKNLIDSTALSEAERMIDAVNPN